jgi:glutamyl-tRNA synthetase
MEVRTRIAPSPTGDPHVGTVYIALFNLIFAKKFGGKFILRIEDTDKNRSLPKYELNIFESLKWANVIWDEGPDIGGDYGPYRQSERISIYQEYVQKLLDEKKAYKCFATTQELKQMREVASKMGKKVGYDRRYRNLSNEEIEKLEKMGKPYVVRLKVPLTGLCEFDDEIKGKITTPWADVDDQVLLKSDGYPTYHLANVVDDHLMKISHVIRGDEWISSTPKHVLLYKYFEWEMPKFMHMPLLLSMDGKKLSKRKNPTSVFYYRDSGFLSKAVVNFLTLMGYSMPDDVEIYSLDEIIKKFDPKRIGLSGAIFDIKKLEWLNQKYIIDLLSEDQLWQRLKDLYFNDTFMKKLMPLVHTRIKTFGDFMSLSDFFFINHINYTNELLCPKKISPIQSSYILQSMIWDLEQKEDWTKSSIEETSHKLSEMFKVNHKKIIMPILFASIMGKKCGLPLYSSCDLLGKDRTRARLLNAIEFLGGISNKKISKLKKGFDLNDCSEIYNEG